MRLCHLDREQEQTVKRQCHEQISLVKLKFVEKLIYSRFGLIYALLIYVVSLLTRREKL